MTSKILLCLIMTLILLTGCKSVENNYQLWVDPSTSSQETLDSAIIRLTKAKVDFIVNENGSVYVNDKDVDKAIMCCS